MSHPRILLDTKPESINHLEAESNYTILKLKNGKKLISGYSLKIFNELFDSKTFVRVNRSHLVNRSFISGIIQKENGHYVRLQNQEELLIPRRKKDRLQWLSSTFQQIAIFLFCVISLSAHAQVVNDTLYNMQIRFDRGWGEVSSESGNSEPTIIIQIAEDKNGKVTSLLNYKYGQSNNGADCFYQNVNGNYYWSPENKKIGSFKESSGVFDWDVMSFENDGIEDLRCVYKIGDDGLGTRNSLWDVSGTTPAQWNYLERTIGSSGKSKFKLKYVWRYSGGQKLSEALDFETLSSGSKTHENTNRDDTGIGSDFGYRNSYSDAPFTSSADVSYKFTIEEAKIVTLSTSYPETDFDTYLHLVLFDDASGNSYTYIDGDDNSGSGSKSYLQKELCPGTYGVIVEGKTSSADGDFKLSVEVSDYVPNPGTIKLSGGGTATSVCLNGTLPAIINENAGTSTLSGVTYTWEKSTDGSNYSPISGTGSGNSSLGTLEASTVYIRRKTSDCGSSAYSNVITYNAYSLTNSGGSISGAKTIPYPHEIENGEISSVSNASSFPSGTVSWEKATLSGSVWSSWSNASPNPSTQGYDLPTLPQTTKFRRKITNICDNTSFAYSNEVPITVINPNGILSGKISSPSGSGVNNVTMRARRITAVPGGQTNKTYITTTGSDGTYSFDGVYYGSTAAGSGAEAEFYIIPEKGDHEFSPDSLLRPFKQTLPNPPDANFTDETVFSVTGTVTQECDDCVGATQGNPKVCPIENVEFLIDDQYLGNQTNNVGFYALSMDQQDTYAIQPRFETHQFNPFSIDLDVGELLEISNVNFVDTTTHTISGIVKADCDQYIGRANLRFSQVLPDFEGNPVASCFVKEITTNLNSGYYSIRLPAGKYKVSVTGFSDIQTGFNADEMKNFLNAFHTDSLTRDITNADATLNLIFEEAPQIAVSGLDGPCSGTALTGSMDLSDNPIFAQNVERPFTVHVFQGDPSKGCYAKDDTLKISTNVHADDVNELFEYETINGQKGISLEGGLPNIISPFEKVLSIDFTDIWGREASGLNLTPIVTGIKTDPGSFATVSPEVPFLILRDPPGDASFSFWEANNTVEMANRFYSAASAGASVWAEVKLGVKYEAGIGFSTESAFWGSIKGTLGVSANIATAKEAITTISSSQYYSTSNNDKVVGSTGDVYIGGAMNLKYARAHEVIYSPDTCSIYRKSSLAIANDGFATTYMYSEGHIVNTLIPLLKEFRDNPANTPAERSNYANQIKVWEQTVKNNTELKRKAKFSHNISFDGNTGPQTSSTTSSSTAVSTVEFGMEINTELALELGMEIGGSGASGGVIVNFKMETGSSSTIANTNSTTTGFTIDDDDSGDFFSIDIKKDPVYNTPVFDLVAGTSSCPHEPGTQARDAIQFTVSDPIQSGIAENGTAIYKLDLGNTSESSEARTYYMRYLTNSSTGVTVDVEGNGVGPFDYPLNHLEEKEITVGVSRFDPNIYSFEGMRFQAYDACGAGNFATIDVSKELEISAFFENACSPITLALPENGFVVNSNSNNLLAIKMLDYNYNNLDNITLEYALAGTSNWTDAFTLSKAQIEDNSYGTIVNFDVTNLIDGEYNFRLKLKCGLQTIYSKRATGTIDRKGPEAFGVPEPKDDHFALGDEISHFFTEDLGCSSINNTNWTATRISNNDPVSMSIGCYKNKIILTPLEDITAWQGEGIQIVLTNIRDAHGNLASGNFEWDFTIGEPTLNLDANAYFANVSAISGTSEVSSKEEHSNPSVSAMATTIFEDELGFLSLNFSLSQPAAEDVTINFILSGSATPNSDYEVSGFRSFSGNEGVVTIQKGTTSEQLIFDPIADTEYEGDEKIILSIINGGDYNIGNNNQVILSILNDDSDDCENGGAPYTLTNNNPTNTAVSEGTYHRLLLESNAFVQAPTTVIFKGERSITLKPGFETQSGAAVFLATLEDCPDVSVSSFASESNDYGKFPTFGSNSVWDINSSQSGQKSIEQNTSGNNEIQISFYAPFEEMYAISLYNSTNASLVKVGFEDITYPKGENSLTLDTSELQEGKYFVEIKSKNQVLYHKIEVHDKK
ncbi:MAG: LytTR family transcriptional regulator DNA-binding domain-containing protein [Cytophagales bacterium]|nr:LytTR family transcriptional regulator DNA-binding domain-containing protein [Cytophagales bacterium]